jgi:hypothetical protein
MLSAIIEAVAKHANIRVILAAAVLTAAAGAGIASANAPSLFVATAQGLLPSADPALLGPITAEGRSGWQCRPEKAAQASSAQDGDLPSDPH